jgi:hypothetical protein
MACKVILIIFLEKIYMNSSMYKVETNNLLFFLCSNLQYLKPHACMLHNIFTIATSKVYFLLCAGPFYLASVPWYHQTTRVFLFSNISFTFLWMAMNVTRERST